MESKDERIQARRTLFESSTIMSLLWKGYTISRGLNSKTSHMCVYRIDTVKYGKVVYYPISDKVFVGNGREWHSYGFKWINENLLYGKDKKDNGECN